MTTPPPASSMNPQTCGNVSATRDNKRLTQPDHAEHVGESGSGVAFLDADSSPADIAVRAIAVSKLEDFRAVLYWHHWCIEIAKAADRGDRATVNALTTQLDRRVGT